MIAEADIGVIWAFVIIASIIGQAMKAAKRGGSGTPSGGAPSGGATRAPDDELREFLESIGQRTARPAAPPAPSPTSSAVRPAPPRPAPPRTVPRPTAARSVPPTSVTTRQPIAPARPKPEVTERHVRPSAPPRLRPADARRARPTRASKPASASASPAPQPVRRVVAAASKPLTRAVADVPEMRRPELTRARTGLLRRDLRADLSRRAAIRRAVVLREVLGPPIALNKGPVR